MVMATWNDEAFLGQIRMGSEFTFSGTRLLVYPILPMAAWGSRSRNVLMVLGSMTSAILPSPL